MPNRPFSPEALERAISNISSRSGVIRVSRALRRRDMDITDTVHADAVLTRFLDLSFEIESRDDDTGESIDSLDHYRIYLYIKRSIVRYYLANYKDGLADAQAFLAISEREGNLGEQAAAWNSISGHLDALGRMKEARDAGARAVAVHRRQGNVPIELANALYTLALCEHRSGLKAAAIEHLTEAIDLLQRESGEDDEYRERRLLAAYILRMKLLRGSNRSVEAAVDVARVIPLLDSAESNVRQWGYIELSQFYYDIEAHSEAMEYAVRSLKIARQIHNKATEVEVLCTLGDIHKFLGERDEAMTLYEDAFRLAGESGHVHVQADAATRLVGMLIDQGRMEEAEMQVGRCLEIVGKKDIRADALIELGRIHKFNGRPAEAMEAFREAIEFSRKPVSRHRIARALYETAVIQRELGEDLDAIASLENVFAVDLPNAADQTDRRVETGVVIEAHALLVNIHRERGDYDRALYHSEQHRELAVARARDLSDRHLANYRALYEVDRFRDRQAQERLARERMEHSLAALSSELLDRQQLIKRLERELQLLVNSDPSLDQGKGTTGGIRSTLRSLREEPQVSSDLYAHLRTGGSRFLATLRLRHPNLTEGQYRLCGLLWSGLDTSEISTILHITLDAVRMNRKRLRKALVLPKETKLEAYLHGIEQES